MPAANPIPATVATDPMLTFLLRIADDNLVAAQRLGELIAGMPDLEEDIAVANVALDHLGHARNLYSLATSFDAEQRGEDQFAMLRSEREFLNAVLVEQPNGDFAQTIVRQFFLDAFQVPLYSALCTSGDEALAGIAARAVKEARYHLEHSSSWLTILGDGTPESHHRAQAAVDELWRYTGDLFERDEAEAELTAHGVLPAEWSPREQFDETVASVFEAAKLTIPEDPYQRLGGRTGMHTAHLGHLLPELQWLYRAHPGATW